MTEKFPIKGVVRELDRLMHHMELWPEGEWPGFRWVIDEFAKVEPAWEVNFFLGQENTDNVVVKLNTVDKSYWFEINTGDDPAWLGLTEDWEAYSSELNS